MVIDDFTRECRAAIEIDRGFSSRRVIRVLEAIAFERGQRHCASTTARN